MKKASLIAILCLLVAATVKSHSSATLVEKKGVEAEEYAVYSAVIQKMFISPDTRTIVIEDEATGVSRNSSGVKLAVGSKLDLPPLTDETYNDLQSGNKESCKLERAFNLPV